MKPHSTQFDSYGEELTLYFHREYVEEAMDRPGCLDQII